MDFKVAGTTRVRHRAAARHQARRHPRLGARPGAAAGQGRPAARSSTSCRRRSTPRTRCRRTRRAIITDEDPGRQDRRGHRPQGQDDQPDPGRHRRRHHHRGRRHDLHRRDRRPVGRGRPHDDQRHRQPHDARGRRALPGHGRQDHDVRRVRLAAARQGRPAAHQQAAALAGGKRVENVEDVVKVGEKIQVEIAEIDSRGKLSLVAGRGRRRPGEPSPAPPTRRPRPRRPRADRPPARSTGRTAVADSSAAPSCPVGCASSPRRCRPSARWRSASGSASARATRPPRSPGPRTSSSTCCSRAPGARRAGDLRRAWTRSAAR